MEENEKLPVDKTGEEITQTIPVIDTELVVDEEFTELGDVDADIKGLDFVEEV